MAYNHYMMCICREGGLSFTFVPQDQQDDQQWQAQQDLPKAAGGGLSAVWHLHCQ